MTPYYDEEGITIYHARCEDVLPFIDPADVSLLLTDPPYGVDYEGVGASGLAASSRTAGQSVVNDDAPFDPSPLLGFDRLILWGANYFAHRLPPGSWVVWDKTGGGKARSMLSDAEVAWRSWGKSIDVFHHLWLGAFRDSEHQLRGVHPTQKPVALMSWIVDRWTEPGDLILDPYMGSGPVAEACYLHGRRYIGVELVEDYCETAVQRLAQMVMFREEVS